MSDHPTDHIVEVHNLKKHFPVKQDLLSSLMGAPHLSVHAVDGVSFVIRRGEVFGLAGESGSGKTTVGRLILRLLDPSEGRIIFNGLDLTTHSSEAMRKLRSKMQIIFQDPFASLNPRMRIGDGIGHGYKIHISSTPEARRWAVEEIMEHVGLTPAAQLYNKFPHQLSGGQRQRAVIARALITRPELIIADEPIAMADVSVRVLLLDLMIRLKNEFNLTYLFITHDLATAKYICDRIGIMYLGKLVEVGDLRDVYGAPAHPYTEALLAAVPVPDPTNRRKKELPAGEIPNSVNPPSGCRFHPRCPIAQQVCQEIEPEMRPTADNPEHLAACHLRTGDYQHLAPPGSART